MCLAELHICCVKALVVVTVVLIVVVVIVIVVAVATDPVWLAELQRRYMTAGAAALPAAAAGHIPGVYPPIPANLPPEILQRERERIGL